ncbi:uncharacterized protein [Embiotoca jacksoni]|uniref:uncharacterized protein n=1 Tax=Embiotoca jacksoni TaxID=100190 RepID=UPI003703E408
MSSFKPSAKKTTAETGDPATNGNTEVTERGPFRVIIVNADVNNTVTIEGESSKEVSLKPWQAAQLWVGEERVVTADNPVAVLFGHPCSIRHNCTCGMLYAALQPAKEEAQTFFIPPHLATDAEAETLVLLSQEKSANTMTFDPESPMVKTDGTVVLYRPGLLLSLIPEADFAGCYVVKSIAGTDDFAVIVVNEIDKDKVRIGTEPLVGSDWQKLKGTDYVSVKVTLQSGISIIWHTSSKIAVYFLGRKDGTLFGNPGHIVGKSPDFRGCALTPLAVDIGETAMGWRESLKYCRDKDLKMLSFSNTEMHQLVSDRLIETKSDSLKEVWMGMRRSSLTGEWYWVDGQPAGDTFWGDGEPGAAHEGQCASMSLKNKKFVWSDEDCCKHIHPVCVKNPIFFSDS